MLANLGFGSGRFDLCEYHSRVLQKTLRGDFESPRDLAEAAYP
jgi:hypothetical protein